MEEKLLHKIEPKTYEQIVNKKYRNYKWLLYFSIIGLSFMFLSLTFMYFVSHDKTHQASLRISPFFYINTFILLISSMAIVSAQKQFREDNYRQYKNYILLILGCGILFLVGQCIGCYTMYASGQNFEYNSASYLYVISGIHALHILGGLVFLSFFFFKSWRSLTNYATSVVYFTDPIAKSQLDLVGIFWHFLGVMWLYLLFFFIAVG